MKRALLGKIPIPFQSIIALVIALLFSGAILLAARSRTADEDKRNLLSLEDRWLASEDDPDALNSILADDFIHALPLGFVTKEEQLNYMRKMQTPPMHGARHFEDMHVRVYGDVGIVNGIVVEDQPNEGVQKTVFTDVFVRRHGRWQAVNAQEVPFREQPPSKP